MPVADVKTVGNRTDVTYKPLGNNRTLFSCKDAECLVAGPAGTGKSRAALEKLHLCALKYEGMRGMIARKTRASLTSSAVRTFEERVLHKLDGVEFHTPTQTYRYPNGSQIVLAGLDKASKVMSADYDIIYIQEATEVTVTDWESLSTRLRFGRMPYQQLLADCNPDSPTHWLKQRCDAGKTTLLNTTHADNPTVTPDYLAKLDSLTGVRYQRLRLGLWAAAEGVIFESYDPAKHITDIAPRLDRAFRVVAGVDWGYTNPGVILIAYVSDTGAVTIAHEIYMTGKTIDWWVDQAKILQRTRTVDKWICDPAEPAYIAAFRSAGLNAVAGYNRIPPGLQAVNQRFTQSYGDTPALNIYRGRQSSIDLQLKEDHKPTGLTEELPGFVWDTRGGQARGEMPLDRENHACDSLRYLIGYLDGVGKVSMHRDIYF